MPGDMIIYIKWLVFNVFYNIVIQRLLNEYSGILRDLARGMKWFAPLSPSIPRQGHKGPFWIKLFYSPLKRKALPRSLYIAKPINNFSILKFCTYSLHFSGFCKIYLHFPVKCYLVKYIYVPAVASTPTWAGPPGTSPGL